MKLGEIKLESLKLMFANVDIDLYLDRIEYYKQDETYRDYLVNMPGAINRCFASIEEKRVLPCKRHEIVGGPMRSLVLRVDMDAPVDDFLDLHRVVYENDRGDYEADISFRREGNTIVLPAIGFGERYVVLYHPTIPRITAATAEDTELPIPDGIAAHIPYFIKGDLFRADEPNEASEARNWYEAAMEAIVSKTEGRSTSVKNIYSQTEGEA
ncbi:MAG: hypothetical protein E7609_05300 [Ruminococcaceae bacterium]|nr:hypothetical protein [Oscillospiraceae bacterium]